MMDEPLGALDAEFRHLMCEELRDLHDRIGATTVYVTHDQLEAMSMADQIAVMNHGVVEQIGKPQEIYDRPATMFVADFIGSPPMNLLPFEGALRRGDRSVAYFGRRVDVPEIGEDVEPGRADARRPARHVALSDCGHPRAGVRRRISRHQPDRHHRHRARQAEGAAAGARPLPGWARTSASRSGRRSSSFSTRRPAGRPRARCSRERDRG